MLFYLDMGGVVKWMRDRDLLIAQTMAFVQSVTGKRPEADRPDGYPGLERPAAPVMPDIDALLAEAIITSPEPPQPIQNQIQVSHPALRSDFQNEIQARVASFRAHQQRFMKERDEYCSTTVAKIQAALDKHPARSRPGK